MTAPIEVTLEHLADYDEWRAAARDLLRDGVAPERVAFCCAGDSADLFGSRAATGNSDTCAGFSPGASKRRTASRVPSAFPKLAKRVLCHRDPMRHALLYRLLWRLQSHPRLLEKVSDADVWRATKLAQAVRRDAHKMKAFVRFRRVGAAARETYVAWFEPEHHIVELAAPFFVRRFTGMNFSIVTPERSAHWNGETLRFSAGATRRDCPDDDALEDHWRVYYASIFNPARLKVNAMRAEMPVRYWRNLPESRLIPALTRSARRAQRAAPAGTAPSVATARRLVARQPDMVATPATPASLDELGRALQGCTRCGLCEQATAAVPGEGPSQARLMLVGEQPGDHEDLAGRPFIGPAGKVLDAALMEAGIERERVYLTNAVKHFKHSLRGKRRIHERPNGNEIEHCRWWLDLERQMVAPTMTVALGASAARAVLGRAVRIAELRGRPLADSAGNPVLVTVHPAYLLRIADATTATRERARFIADLEMASRLAG